jgi:excisionase family DNA binding protein
MSDILTKDEVAAMLDCEPSTVEEKARTRELPGVKIGRSWIFPREALMKRLNEIALRAAADPMPPRYTVQARPNRRAPPALPSV